jgi:hypothetical protein
MPAEIKLGGSWDWFKELPPCRLCGKPLSGWISSDSVHLECAEQYPDAMYWSP